MNDARYRYLVQRMFDEELPPEVSYAVKGYLDTSEQGSSFYLVLKELLQAVEELPLPDELKPEQPELLKTHITQRVHVPSSSPFRFLSKLFGKQAREAAPKDNPFDPNAKTPELTLIRGGKNEPTTEQDDVQTITKRLRAINRAREESSEIETQKTSLRETLTGDTVSSSDSEAPKTLADAIRKKMRETKEFEQSGSYSVCEPPPEPLPDSWEAYSQENKLLEDQEPSQSFVAMEAFYTASESFVSARVAKTLDEVFNSKANSTPATCESSPIEPVSPLVEPVKQIVEELFTSPERPRFHIPCDPAEELVCAWSLDGRGEMTEVQPVIQAPGAVLHDDLSKIQTAPVTTTVGNVYTDDFGIKEWITDGASFANANAPLSFLDPTTIPQPLFNAVPHDLFGADYEKAMSSVEQTIFQSVPENLFGPQFDRASCNFERPTIDLHTERPQHKCPQRPQEGWTPTSLQVQQAIVPQPQVVPQQTAPPEAAPQQAVPQPAPYQVPPQTSHSIPVDEIMEQLGRLFVDRNSDEVTPRIVAVKPRDRDREPIYAAPAPSPPAPIKETSNPVVNKQTEGIVFDAPVLRQVARLKTTADDHEIPPGKIQTIGKFLLTEGTRDRIALMLNRGVTEGRLKVLTAEASSEINEVLISLEQYDGVIGSVIVGYDGLILASTLPSSLDSELVSAWALMSYMSTSEVSSAIGYGRIYQIASRTSTGYVLLADFGQALLVTLCNNPASDALVPLMRKVMELTA